MYPLGILILLTIFSMIFGDSLVSTVIEGVIDNKAIINGSTTTIELNTDNLLFSIDPLTGALTWIIVLIALVAVLGINIFGSGLSETSVRAITIGTTYGALWIIFSLYSSALIIEIEIFGYLIYIIFTIIYALGVIEKIAGDSVR